MSYTFFKILALFNLLEAHSIGNYLYLYSSSNLDTTIYYEYKDP